MSFDPESDGAKVDLAESMTYGDYLDLDRLLAAQHPRSPDHNELLFIVQHQTSELWMKLMLHELKAACDALAQDRVSETFKMLARVSRIMEQLVHAWDVLSTLTPSEYSQMRPYLGASSGFQSWQYREIEFTLGNKNEAMLKPHRHTPAVHAHLAEAFNRPSLYERAAELLVRRGFQVDVEARSDGHCPSLEKAWLEVYQAPKAHWDLYELGEELIDLEDAFRQWRFRHVTTVERIIGFKRGTGGTSGVSYLRQMLDVVLFPELWNVRTSL